MHEQLPVYEFCIANFFNIVRIYLEVLLLSLCYVRLGGGSAYMGV
jgi:hypothetical protein